MKQFSRSAKILGLTYVVLAAAALACGSSSATSDNTINFTGTWTGTLGTGADANGLTWTATQSGGTITGPLIIAANGSNTNGTLTGVVTGGQLALTMTVAAGAIANVPACSVHATGTSTTATATSIIVSMATTFAQACVGTVSDGTTETDQVTLTKH